MFDFGIVAVRDKSFLTGVEVALVGIIVNGTLWWVEVFKSFHLLRAFVLDNRGRKLRRIW